MMVQNILIKTGEISWIFEKLKPKTTYAIVYDTKGTKSIYDDETLLVIDLEAEEIVK